MNDLLVMPNIKDNIWWVFLGIIMSVLTIGLVFYFYSGAFFNRGNYFNRITLYRWIKTNDLPDYNLFWNYKIWNINGLTLALADSKVWYLNEKNNTGICSFCCGRKDKKMYNEILKILQSETNIKVI